MNKLLSRTLSLSGLLILIFLSSCGSRCHCPHVSQAHTASPSAYKA